MSNLSPRALALRNRCAGLALLPEEWEVVAQAVEGMIPAWQSIETATPGDTEVILGCVRGQEKWSEAGFWHDGSANYWRISGWYSEMDRGDLLTAKAVNPTHWMPLPAPPTDAETAGA